MPTLSIESADDGGFSSNIRPSFTISSSISPTPTIETEFYDESEETVTDSLIIRQQKISSASLSVDHKCSAEHKQLDSTSISKKQAMTTLSLPDFINKHGSEIRLERHGTYLLAFHLTVQYAPEYCHISLLSISFIFMLISNYARGTSTRRDIQMMMSLKTIHSFTFTFSQSISQIYFLILSFHFHFVSFVLNWLHSLQQLKYLSHHHKYCNCNIHIKFFFLF